MGLGDFNVDALQAQMRETSVEPPSRDDLHKTSEEASPEYRDSIELDPMRMGGDGGGEESEDMVELPVRRPKSKQTSEKKRSVRTANNTTGRKLRIQSEFSQIRDFPKELLTVVKSEFPMASNNTDALAAYVYVKSGGSVSVPDSVKELAEQWDGDRSVENLTARIEYLEKKSKEMVQMLEEMELLICFHLFDRLGYRKEMPKSLRSIDLLEQDGAYDIMKRAREQARQLRKQINMKEGRPIE